MYVDAAAGSAVIPRAPEGVWMGEKLIWHDSVPPTMTGGR